MGDTFKPLIEKTKIEVDAVTLTMTQDDKKFLVLLLDKKIESLKEEILGSVRWGSLDTAKKQSDELEKIDNLVRNIRYK